jgi:hypothetical protein
MYSLFCFRVRNPTLEVDKLFKKKYFVAVKRIYYELCRNTEIVILLRQGLHTLRVKHLKHEIHQNNT